MTEKNLFKPTPELMQEWLTKWKDKKSTVPYDEFFATQAACWGADQQLEQDAEWLDSNALYTRNLTVSLSGDALRQVMRSEPLSLKEKGLKALLECYAYIPDDLYYDIKEAIESLSD